MNRIEISFPKPMSVVSDPQSEKHEFLEMLGKRNQTDLGTLIDLYHSRLLQLARMFVQNEAEAEEVVREMGVKILQGIQGDKDRSCLEILMFQVFTKRIQTCAVQKRWGKSPHVH